MKKLLRFSVVLSLIFTVCFTSACGDWGRPTQKYKIVATFYPLYIMALNIADGVDNVEVVNLTDKRTGSLSDYQLTSGNMRMLADANVLIINGSGLENFVPRVQREYPRLKIVDATKDMSIDWLHEKNGRLNSHVWMNILYNIEEVRAVAKGLAEADPDHASLYDTNARHYEEKLRLLESEMHKEIDELPNRDVVVYHEAFPYFAQEFNLNIIANITDTPGHSPSYEEMDDVVQKLAPFKKKVIFTESVYAPDSAELIAYKAGAQIYTLDPFERGESNKDAYIEAMQKNARSLREPLR